MTTLFQARPYGRPVEITNNIRRKKLHRMDQSFIFLEAVLAIDSVRASTQFRRKRESLHLQLRYFFKNRFIHFHISSVRVIRPFERNKLSFLSIEINKSFPAPVSNVLQVRFKFRSQL